MAEPGICRRLRRRRYRPLSAAAAGEPGRSPEPRGWAVPPPPGTFAEAALAPPLARHSPREHPLLCLPGILRPLGGLAPPSLGGGAARPPDPAAGCWGPLRCLAVIGTQGRREAGKRTPGVRTRRCSRSLCDLGRVPFPSLASVDLFGQGVLTLAAQSD